MFKVGDKIIIHKVVKKTGPPWSRSDNEGFYGDYFIDDVGIITNLRCNWDSDGVQVNFESNKIGSGPREDYGVKIEEIKTHNRIRSKRKNFKQWCRSVG